MDLQESNILILNLWYHYGQAFNNSFFFFCQVLFQVAHCAAVSLGWVSHAKRGLCRVRTTVGFMKAATLPTADSETDSTTYFFIMDFSLQKHLQNVHCTFLFTSLLLNCVIIVVLFLVMVDFMMFVLIPLLDVFCIIYNKL